MTAVQIPTSEVLFTKLLCYLGEWHQDTSADPDAHPDLMTVGGKVKLTINTPDNLLIVRLGNSPARLTRFKAQDFIIQTATGELVDANGVAGVSVPRSDSPGLSPTNWTITAEIQFAGTSSWKKVTFLPKDLPEFNLIDLVSVSPSPGEGDLAARVAILEAGGVPGGGGSTAWGDITGKPSSYPPDVEATQDVVGAMIAGAVKRRSGPPYEMPTAAPYNVPVYCDVPTYDKTGSSLHFSVIDMHNEIGRNWRGWRYWACMTPYFRQDFRLENPSIIVSNDGFHWVLPNGIRNPVFPPPRNLARWNADGDIAYDPGSDQIVMLFGAADLQTGSGFARSRDGVSWPSVPGPVGKTDHMGGSPSIFRDTDGRWTVYSVWTGSGGASGVRVMRRHRADHSGGPYSEPGIDCTGLGGMQADGMWHAEVLVDDRPRLRLQQHRWRGVVPDSQPGPPTVRCRTRPGWTQSVGLVRDLSWFLHRGV